MKVWHSFFIFFLLSNTMDGAQLDRSVFKAKDKVKLKKDLVLNNCSNYDVSVEITISEEIIDTHGNPIKHHAEHTIPLKSGESRSILMSNDRIVDQSFVKLLRICVYKTEYSNDPSSSNAANHSPLSELIGRVYKNAKNKVAQCLQTCDINVIKEDINKNIVINIFPVIGGTSLKIDYEFRLDEITLNEKFKTIYSEKYTNKEFIQKFFIDLYNIIKSGPNSELNKNLLAKGLPLFLVTTEEQMNFIKKVEQGMDLYRLSSSNELFTILSKATKLEDLLSYKKNLIWFFYGIAISKGEYFNEGILVLEDPGHQIHNALLWNNNGYWPHVFGNPSYCSNHFSNYISTLKYDNTNNAHEFNQNYIEIADLPNGYPHILFGKLDNNKIFIKLLDYNWTAAFYKVSYSKETSFHRKEHISQDLIDEYVKELKSLSIANLENLKSIVNSKGINYMIHSIIPLLDGCYDDLLKVMTRELENSKRGIPSYIIAYINTLKNNSFKEQNQALSPSQKKTVYFIVKLLDRYDNTNLRVGNEVIISYEELKQFLP